MELSSNEQLVYLAGYFDGEGCIFSPNKPNYPLVASVETGDEEIVQLFYDTFGGSLTVSKPRKWSRRKTLQWSVQGIEAQSFLKAVLPYLRSAKRTLAELCQLSNFRRTGRGGLQQEELDRRFAFYNVSKAVNNRVTVERPN